MMLVAGVLLGMNMTPSSVVVSDRSYEDRKNSSAYYGWPELALFMDVCEYFPTDNDVGRTEHLMSWLPSGICINAVFAVVIMIAAILL